MAKTKIIIIRTKEIITTALLIALAILLIIFLVFMFKPGNNNKDSVESAALYNAGTYSSQLSLNNTTLNLQVTVDPDRVKSVELVNIDESVQTMFPLLMPSIDDIEAQLVNQVDIENIVLSEDCRYTQTLLIDSLKTVLDKAKINSPD